MKHDVGVHVGGFGQIDYVTLEACGALDVVGWTYNDDAPVGDLLGAACGGEPLPLNEWYRCYRPDVASSLKVSWLFKGFTVRFLLGEGSAGAVELHLKDGGGAPRKLAQVELPGSALRKPDYAFLRTTEEVLGRSEIYGQGPPGHDISPEVWSLVSRCRGPFLDFGCGNGSLIKKLLGTGAQAEGIEISRREITDSLEEALRGRITLYDGRLPIPYADGQFETATCLEVLEHTEEPFAVLGELSRVCRSVLILTVPDMTVIPLLHKHRVVPWHLLDSSHLNFFTQRSLGKMLKAFFGRVSFYRSSFFSVNETMVWTSLLALCCRSDSVYAELLP